MANREQGTLTKELMESEGRTSTSVRVPRTEPIVSHVAQRAAFFSDLHPFCSEAVQVCVARLPRVSPVRSAGDSKPCPGCLMADV